MRADLTAGLARATGSDPALDTLLASALDAPARDYTASVDACLALIRAALPGWGWHLGWHADGVRPYARLHDAAGTAHVEAAGPTVPIALLRALAKALTHAPATADPQAGSAPAGGGG